MSDDQAYTEFRDRIRNLLTSADRPMTWTEIRRELDLQQKAPNNQWVRSMSNEIGLERRKIKGVMHWSVPTITVTAGGANE